MPNDNWLKGLEKFYSDPKTPVDDIIIPPSDPIPKNVKDWKIDPEVQRLRDEAARKLRLLEIKNDEVFDPSIEDAVDITARGRVVQSSWEPSPEEIKKAKEEKEKDKPSDIFSKLSKFYDNNKPVETEEPTDSPSWLSKLEKYYSPTEARVPGAFMSGVDEFGSILAKGVAGVTSIGGEATDPITSYFVNQSNKLQDQALTPEQLEKLPFNKKVARLAGLFAAPLAATGAAVAAGVGGGPLFVASGILGGLTTIGTKGTEVEQGVGIAPATVAGVIETMANTAANMVPAFNKTPGGAMLIGGAVNAIQGMFTDTVNKVIYANTDGNKTFADKYNPLDLEARALDFIAGGVPAFVSKYGDAKRLDKAQRGALVNDVIERLQRDFDGPLLANIKDYDFTRDYTSRYASQQDTWTALVRDLTNDNFIDYNGQRATIPETERIEVLLDYARKNPTSPAVKAEADYISSLWEFVKDDHKVFGEILREKTSGPDGNYNTVNTELSLNPDLSHVGTFIHEMRHLVTASAMKKALAMNLPEYQTLNKHGKYIVDSIRNFNKFYEYARLKFVKHHAPELHAEIAAFETGRMSWRDLWDLMPMDGKAKYNMKNVHEFMADLTTRPEGRAALDEIKISPTEAKPYGVNFQGSKLGKFLVGGNRELKTYGDKSLLDLGLFHAGNIYDYLLRGGVGKIGTGVQDPNPNATAIRGMFESAEDIEDIMARMPSHMDPLVEGVHQFMLRKIGQLISKSDTPGENEWAIKMSAIFPQNPEWAQFVKDNTANLLKNSPRYSAIYDEFVKNPDNDPKTRAAVDPRSIETIFKDMFENFGNKEDLNRHGTTIFGKEQLGLIKNRTLGDLMAKHYNDKINEYRILKEQLYTNFVQFQQKFMELPDDNSRIKTMNAAADWDSPLKRDALRRRNIMWPDENDLRTQNGLNDAEIAAYKQMADGYDYMYNVLDTVGSALQARFHGDDLVALQLPNYKLKRIPGFMPHFHEGTVKVKVVILDQNGQPMSSYMKGFGSILTAEHFIRKINKLNDPQIILDINKDTGKRYFTIDNRSPGSHGLMSTLVDNYEAYSTFSTLAPELANKLAQLDMDDARGYNKSLLKRSDVGGYTNEPGMMNNKMKSYFGIFRNKSANSSFALYEKYARGVADFAGNTFFVKDVWAPMLMTQSSFGENNVGEITNKMPRFKKYIEDQTRTFTGESVNKLAFIDDALSDLAVGMKTNPQFFKFLNRNIRGAMSTIMLRNPRNWYANFLQPINGVGIMYSYSVEHGLVPLDPQHKTSPYASLAKAYDQIYGGATPETYQVMEWARARGITKPVQDLYYGVSGHIVDVTLQKLDHALMGGVNPTIEEISRTATYLTAYDYMKQFYNNKMDAMLAAERLTAIVMVNYDRSSRPHLYTKFGIAGEAASSFAVFRNAYIGNSYYMLKTVMKNPTKIDAYKGLIAGQLGYIMTAGLLGVVGASEYNALVDMYNSVFSSDEDSWKFPRLEEFATKYGLPDWAMFGLGAEASKSIPLTPEGFHIGASAGAAGTTSVFSPPLIPFIQALVTFGIVGLQEGRALIDDSYAGANSNDIYNALKKLTPPQLHDSIRRAFANDNDVGARAGNTEGMIDLTESDIASTILFGSTGLHEWTERRIAEAMNRKMTSMREHVKNFVDKAADGTMGIPGGKDMDSAYKGAVKYNPILTWDEFEQAVIKERLSRITSKKTRESLQKYDPTTDRLRNQYESR